MSPNTNDSVSGSLEVEPHLLPHMPYLLQDLWALGSSVERILEAVGTLGLPPGAGTQVLDLGCGKGAVSVRLAETYGFQVLGIDAMAPFLDEARTRAEEHGVAGLCRFEEGDVLEFVSVERAFRLVILASVGGILGSIRRTVERLRKQVRTGGYILIEDGYLKRRRRVDRKGYEHCRDRETTLLELTSLQDRLVVERSTTEACRSVNREYLEVITKRAAELADRHPGLREDLLGYVRLQQEECAVLDEELEGALWVLEKTASR